MRYPILLALALTSLAPTATAQGIAWETDPGGAPGTRADGYDLVALPGGGVLSAGFEQDVVGGTPVFPGLCVVERFDENGDRMWRSAFTASFTGSYIGIPATPIDLAIGPAGEIYVLAFDGTDPLLRRLSGDGSVQWQRALTGPPTYRARAVDVQADGTVVVAGNFEESFYPRFHAQTFAPDGTPGWVFDGDGGQGLFNNALGVCHGLLVHSSGRIVLYGTSDATLPDIPRGAYAMALDASGAVDWRRGVGCRLDYGVVRHVAEAPSGDLVFLPEEGDFSDVVSLTAAVVVTPAGSVTNCFAQYRRSTQGVHGVAVDDLGGIHVLHTDLGSPTLRLSRFDPAGIFIGDEVVPGATGSYDPTTTRASMASLEGDPVSLVVRDQMTDTAYVTRWDPTGSAQWTAPVAATPTQDNAADMVVDARGNLVLTVGRSVGGAATARSGEALVKVVPDEAPGIVFCGPAVVNSTGLPAELALLGSSLASADNLTVRVDDLPRNSFVLFIASQAPVMNPNGGNGSILCIGGQIGRFVGPGQIRQAGAAGTVSLQLDLPALPSPTGSVVATAGQSWYFQAWYRDQAPGLSYNFSDASVVLLQ